SRVRGLLIAHTYANIAEELNELHLHDSSSVISFFQLEIISNEGFNLFGYGGKRKMKLVTGNGTFHIEKEDAALVNGSPFGGSGALSFDKDKGIDIGQNVTLGNQTAVGGPGRESNFLAELLSAINQLIPKPSR
ncbi:hypothetical protein OSTOST_24040, partial [Ostertagia ostertagi]